MGITDFWSEMTLAGWLTLLTLAALSITMIAVSFEVRGRLQKRRLRGDWLLRQLELILEKGNPEDPSGLKVYLAQLERPESTVTEPALEQARPESPPLPRPHPIVEEVRQIDLFSMTPLDALNRLAELKRLVADSDRCDTGM